ncbi:Beta-propeller repeat protein [Polystyrenella longa]|uniref:Beta-propeller repeat protein n=1 Tax=Polystyrenella longa TaxID=2528007 RepID=A0A518CTJ1_9PLAN|nr:hypothetical protein [Polystyrenella longa]QDU82538.1 Beta-propeller repeat protein [Polystyrenella longa]
MYFTSRLTSFLRARKRQARQKQNILHSSTNPCWSQLERCEDRTLLSAPVADAGGSYTFESGAAFQLDASATFDADQDNSTLDYQWDLDGDGILGETGSAALYGDEVGIKPVFSTADIPAGSSLSILLQVTDNSELSDSVSTTVNVTSLNVDFAFSANFGNGSSDAGYGVSFDSEGNTITVGRFSDVVDFDPGAGSTLLSSNGASDAFIFKQDPAGNQLWAKNLGGANNDRANGVVVDQSGAIYITGYFEGTVDFDPGANVHNLTSNGADDVFVLKLDSAGSFVWARSMGGTDTDEGEKITLGSNGDVYLTGLFEGSVDFNPGPGTFTLTAVSASPAAFITRLSGTGDFVWAKSIGADSEISAYDIEVDSQDNVFITGLFEGTADFDPGIGSFTLTSGFGGLSYNMYLVSLDQSGDFNWAYSVLGDGDSYSEGTTIAVDSSDNLYVSGYFSSESDFDFSPGTFRFYEPGDPYPSDDGYFMKISNSGVFQWVKPIIGDDDDWAYSIAIDNEDRIYVAGLFGSSIDLDPGPSTYYLTGVGSDDIFIAQYDIDGNFQSGQQVGGTDREVISDFAVGGANGFALTGRYLGTADFDPTGGTYNLTSNGSYDAFVVVTGANTPPTADAGGPYQVPIGSVLTLDATATFDLNQNDETLEYLWDFDGDNIFGETGPAAEHGDELGRNPVFDTNAFLESEVISVSLRVIDSDGATGIDSAEITVEKVIPDLGFAYIGNTTETARSTGVATDSTGNTYSIGYYEDSMTIDPLAASPDLISSGGQDAYLTKHDSQGNLVWIKTVESSQDETFRGIVIDESDEILLTGTFDSTVDFDPGAGVFEMTSSDSLDVFLLKLDENGDFLWATSFGGPGAETTTGITYDSSGNIITYGIFGNSIDLDPSGSTFILNSNGNSDAFLAAYSSTGSFLWGNQFGGSNSEYITDVDFDATGNIYLTGEFEATVDFDPGAGTENLTSFGSSDIFLAKLTSTGDYVWAERFGNNLGDSGLGILVHDNGDLYVTGVFSNGVDFDPGPGLVGIIADSFRDIFIARYTQAGSLVWAQSIAGTTYEVLRDIEQDSEGNIYLAGEYEHSISFENGPVTTTLTSPTGANSLLVKMDPEGNYVWALDFEGTYSNRIQSIAIDPFDNISMTGMFLGDVDFDPGHGTFTLSSDPGIYEPDSDIFISKLIQNEIVQEEPTYKTPETLISYSTRGQQRTGVAGQRSVAAAADGRYVTTWWSDEGDGDGAGVFAQLYRADGSKVGGPFIVSTTTDEDQINPSAAMQADGSFMIAWQSDSDPGAGVNWEIHAQRYLASGLLDGGEIAINSELASNQSLADVVYLANGHFVVTWTGKGPGDANGIFARIFDASGNPQGPEFLVNGTTAGAQVNPSLTADRAGGFAAVWHGDGTGDSNGVFFRRFDQLGTALSSEVRVNQTVAGVQQTASVTQTNNDDFIVAWSGEGTGDSNGIFTRRLTPLGDVTGNEILVNQTTGGNQVTPSITPDLTTNGYLVTWSHQNSGNDYDIKLRPFNGSDVATEDEQTINQVLENRQWNPTIIQRSTSSGDQYVLAWGGYGDGDTAGVFTRALDSSLNPITPETLVSSSTKGQQRTGVGGQHAAATAADGRYVTTWWSDEGDGDGAGVFGLLYRADGSKVGGPFIVSTTTDEDQINPSVAMQETGQFVIVWQTDADSGAGVNWEIHGQRFLASGLLDGSEFLINSETVSNQTLADVVYLDNGSFVVTWTGKGPGDANGVFARIFDAGGTPLGTEFQVNETTAGAQLNPSLTEDSAGGFAVVWHGEGTGDDNGIFFRRFDNSGLPLTNEILINSTSSGLQDSARVTQTATGDFIVTWSGEGVDDSAGIYARRLDPSGALSGLEILVNEETDGNQVTPAVVANSTGGGFLIVWSHQNTGIDYDIKFRKFDESDSPVTASQLVNQVTKNRQWNPTIIQRPTSEGNDFLIIWSGNGDGDTAGVFTRQFTFEEPIEVLSLSFVSDEVFAEGLEEVLD